MTELCEIGRIFDPAHPTCRTCLIGCVIKSEYDAPSVEIPTLDEIGKKHGLPGRKPKQNKHKNKKVEVDGIMFDSKREASRYTQLKALEVIGAISGLERQAPFILLDSVVLDGRRKSAVVYKADFIYRNEDTGLNVVEDSKSPHLRKHPVYRLKKHMMRLFHGIDILET